MHICTSENFDVYSARKPHVSREDGGHLVIVPKISVTDRWDLNDRLALEFMQLSQLVGRSMKDGLNNCGIDVRRINFQDNGNWGLDTPEGPKLHLHLYGRAKNSVNQMYGESLRFPDQKTRFWENIKPLNESDVLAIQTEIRKNLPYYEDNLIVQFP